jgi:endonuclease/exonuclease/phosphatase family metal-dependent hydrolase
MLLTVATYNINACVVNTSKRVDVARYAAMVKTLRVTHGATLVAMQECGGGSNGQAKQIAAAAGFPYYYFGPRENGSNNGNAILSMYPLADKRNSLAPHNGGSTCITSALITVPGASIPFRFGSAHYPVTNTNNRMTAVGNMIQEGLKYGNYLIGGDFNSSNGSIEFRCLDAFGWAPSCLGGCPVTTNHAPPAKNWAIDYVFTLGIPKALTHVVVNDGTFDHQPVVVGVELP